jgi:TonB family protein
MLSKACVITLLLSAIISAGPTAGAAAHDESSPPAIVSANRAQPPHPALQLKRIRYSAPEYPAKALYQQLSGRVTIDFIIDTNGDPTELRIIEAHPAGVFNRAALEAVRRWRYKPYVVGDAHMETARRAIVHFEAFTDSSNGR